MTQSLSTPPLRYCANPYSYRRRLTREVRVGNVGIGGSNPIRVQSMTTTRTQDVEGTVAQVIRLVEVGCEIVRITAPTVQDARAIGGIREQLRARGFAVPLVADIHFSPEAALEAADHVDKVRVNPGNYADAKHFRVLEYSDEQYEAELERVEARFTPLVLKCKARGIAMRVGTNHGSLSDRIMNRFGDTPLGMVESALEFLRICEKHDYRDVVLSMKASNPKIMIQAYRLLVARMEQEGMHYPLHLGVTEAGNAEDGRIKSAIGIGSLLADGLGDTIRVSLTEEPEAEVPVAYALVAPYNARLGELPPLAFDTAQTPQPGNFCDPYTYTRRVAHIAHFGALTVGGREPVRVAATRSGGEVRWAEPAEDGGLSFQSLGGTVLEETGPEYQSAVARLVERAASASRSGSTPLLALRLQGVEETIHGNRLLSARLAERGLDLPIHLCFDASEFGQGEALLWSAVALGSLLCDGIGDSVEVAGFGTPGERARLAFAILQGAGVRATRTEFVACPSCGRTLFDLQSTTDRIKSRTGHLPGLKIAVMGCVVNGPGEMADADFGYVGGAPGRVNLYVGKEVVERNVPEDVADERLIELIRSRGRWVEPPDRVAAVPDD